MWLSDQRCFFKEKQMRSEGRKQRHKQLVNLIESNPLLTDEEISSALGVSLSTVRLDRGLLAIP